MMYIFLAKVRNISGFGLSDKRLMQFSYPPTVPSPLGVGYTLRFHMQLWTWYRNLVNVHIFSKKLGIYPRISSGQIPVGQ